MRAYLGIKYHPDNRNRETVEMLSEVLAKGGFEAALSSARDVERWGAVFVGI